MSTRRLRPYDARSSYVPPPDAKSQTEIDANLTRIDSERRAERGMFWPGETVVVRPAIGPTYPAVVRRIVDGPLCRVATVVDRDGAARRVDVARLSRSGPVDRVGAA